VQVSQNGLKLNGTHQFLVYADDVNTFDGSVQSIKKKQKLVVASKETGLEVNVNKIMDMVVSRE